MWWPSIVWIQVGTISDWLGVAALAIAAILFVVVVHRFATTKTSDEEIEKTSIPLSYGILLMLGIGLVLNPGGDRSAITRYVGVAAGWGLFLSYSLKVAHDREALNQSDRRLRQDRALTAQSHAQTEQRLIQDRQLNARAHSQTEQRLLQERLLKACEQLSANQAASRAAALIVLERIALEADPERPFVVRIAAQFLRSICIPAQQDSLGQRLTPIVDSLMKEANKSPNWDSWLDVFKSALTHGPIVKEKPDDCLPPVPSDAEQAIKLLRSCGRNTDKLDLRGVKYHHGDLSGARWSGSVLNNASFLDSSIENCEWAKVAAREVNLSRSSLQNGHFEFCDMQDAVMGNTDARNSWFEYADLSKATISAKTDFSGAHCRGLALSRSKVNDVLFCNADLHEAIFDEAELESVDFTGAQVTWAQLLRAKVRRDLKGEMIEVEKDPLKGVVAARLDGEDILGS